ncbi:MAG TPA: hypothetical protein VIL31_10780 [Cyclobacteriaceae bacterium]
MILLCVIQARAQNLENIGKTKPFSISGGVSSRLVFYDASGVPQRRDPFGYVLSGNVNVGIYELYLPFSFTYSNQGTSYSQPFNQFGVSPTYKWVTLHLGYQNITHSSFTLAGHQMLGAGFDLNPGKLRVGFMYGRLRRATRFIPPSDSLSLDTLLQIHPLPVAEDPVYKRTGWSAKIGYGDHSNFIDLILFKAADDPSSIADDSIKQIVRPAENAVIGINARKMLFKKLSIYFEGAISAYTRDKEFQDESSASDSVNLSKLFKPFIPINGTTYYYRALKTGLNYTHTRFSVQAEYQRIDPDYKSMGAYFFNNDIESISLTPVFYLMQNKIIATTGLIHQRDNLNNKKYATTRRTMPRLNLSINPSYRYGFDIGYQDMLTSQTSGLIELTDSTRMKTSNPGITLGGRYNIIDTLRTHTFMLMFNQFELKDKNPTTQLYSEYSAAIINFSYSFYLVKKALGLNASFTSNKLDSYNGVNESFGFALGGSKGFEGSKYTVNGSWSANFSDFGDSQSINAGLGFTPGGRFSANLNLTYLTVTYPGSQFNEFTGFVEGRYNFGKKGKP